MHGFVSTASQNEVPATTPLEELTYRRSLRVALDLLNEKTSLNPESHLTGDRTTLSQKEQPHAAVASQVSDAPSPSFLSEDGQDVAAQCAPKRRWECAPHSLLGLSAFEEDPGYRMDHKTGLSKNGTPRAGMPSPSGDGSPDGSGSWLDHEQEDPTNKRQKNLEERPLRRRRTESHLSKERGAADSREQARCCGSLASPQLPSQTQEEEGPCAGVKGCDLVMSSGGRGHPTKRPRLDGGQNPPTRQLGMRTVGTAPSTRSCPGDKAEEGNCGQELVGSEGNHGHWCLVGSASPGLLSSLRSSDFLSSQVFCLCV